MVPVTRFLPVDMDLLTSAASHPSASPASVAERWDAAISKADEQFSERMHNIATNNCHHHTAMALSEMGLGSGWSTQVQLAWRMMLHGRWKSTGAMLCTLGPFLIIVTVIVLASALTR